MMTTSKNYYKHLLSPSERDNFRQLVDQKYPRYKETVYSWLKTLPYNIWLGYLDDTIEKKKPLLIKLICLYIWDEWLPNDYFEFNDTVTLIRRKS